MWNDKYFLSSGQLPIGQRISKSAPCSPLKPLIQKRASSRPDSFHVIHKVPVGDSPYVKAKHVQLVDKDPERAIALFWAAINAGDRVDSALKDMAIVMKQQNRPEEAIEAIKSLRDRCSDQAQESLDNVLLDLYKRCGRLDDQIALLKYKLNLIHQGMAFNGKRTKTARSQGKKFQVSIEQEATRLLGNLGWAYMQQANYVAAEAVYRKALSIEPDNNKVCNLGICLMKQGRLPEAKVILQSVTPACSDSRWGTDSHLKSYERAQQMLLEMENSTFDAPPPAVDTLQINSSLAWPSLSGLPVQIPLEQQFNGDDAMLPSISLKSSILDQSIFSSYVEAWDDEEGEDGSVDENYNTNYIQETVPQDKQQRVQWHADLLKQKLEKVRKEKWEDQNHIPHTVRHPLSQHQNSHMLNVEAPPFTLHATGKSSFQSKTDAAVFSHSSKVIGLRDDQERLPLAFDRTNNHTVKAGNGSPLALSELSTGNSKIGMNMFSKPLPTKAEQWRSGILQENKPSSRRTLSFDSSQSKLPIKAVSGTKFIGNLSHIDVLEDIVEEMTKSLEELGFVETSNANMTLPYTNQVRKTAVSEYLQNDALLSSHKSTADLDMNCRRRLQVFMDMTLPASPQV
ncbi:hypothetical protein O6H91_09G068500 [Diphasiastrum complanatum]|uniref:Uncharacterized protein n=1 Tax=Diphasiastrum complanatum TaxID=34168 RepID=A0ACC2CQA7_DIPCM|nr:hypothetical protein O6H91_09G068500 [Diphasiastrum complanatum]